MSTNTSHLQSGRLYCTPSPSTGSIPDSSYETAVATKGAVVNSEEDPKTFNKWEALEQQVPYETVKNMQKTRAK